MSAGTILIADDSAGQRKVLELTLKKHNYETLIAENGQEALDLLETHMPDLLLLDVNMPFASGIDVCQHTKDNTRLAHIPVIIMTSMTDEKVKQAARNARANLIVHKPLSNHKVCSVISSLLPAKHQA